MWIAKLIIKHDCLIANKCREYNVSTISVPFSFYTEKGTTYSPEFHTLWGDEKNIRRFIKAVQKDKYLKNVEVDGNKIFLVEVTKKRLPVTIRANLNQKIIWTKPISINVKGEEFWEVASWDKKNIINFISETEKISEYIILESIREGNLKDIYYTRLLPNLSPQQKKAITLALEQGYYEWPRKTDLTKLAQRAKLSVPTFREHLNRAEKKILPDLIRQL